MTAVTARDVACIVIQQTAIDLLVAIELDQDYSTQLAAHRRALDQLADLTE